MLNFLTKSLIKRQLKDVPPDQLEKIFEIIDKNPDFFMKLAGNVQEKMKSGMSQEEAVKALMEDTDLSVDGVTLAEALKDAKPATDPRERATEVQSLASMPFLLRKLNNALAEVYELKQGNKIRNGTAPKLSDGQPKTQALNGHNPDANAVFKGHGSFGG